MVDSALAGVVLAAGESRRMGRPKQLLPFGERTILERVVDTLLTAGVGEVIVVLGHLAARTAMPEPLPPTRQLSQLLLRYEELREQGQVVAAEKLCGDCPDLLPQLRQCIHALESVDSACTAGNTPADTGPPPAAAPAVPGYEVLGELGRGGMGVVLRARDGRTGREVALKTLLRPQPEALARFRREAEALAALDHPGIVKVHGTGEADGRPYMVCELVEGARMAVERVATGFPGLADELLQLRQRPVDLGEHLVGPQSEVDRPVPGLRRGDSH